MSDNDNHAATIIISIFIGGIIGAGLALLLAPQSGRKTRRQIADLADDARELAADSAKKLRKKVS